MVKNVKSNSSNWYVVDENNNVLAGPFAGLQQVVTIADSISLIESKRRVGIIREDQLEKKRKFRIYLSTQYFWHDELRKIKVFILSIPGPITRWAKDSVTDEITPTISPSSFNIALPELPPVTARLNIENPTRSDPE